MLLSKDLRLTFRDTINYLCPSFAYVKDLRSMKISVYTQSMVKIVALMVDMSPPEFVTLVYACYKCNEIKSEGRNLRTHLLTHHSINLPKLKRGQRHYNSTEHIFVKQSNINNEQVVNQRFACPSCLAHFVSYDEYKTHVTSSHTDLGVDSVVLPQKRKKDSTLLFSKTLRSYSKPKFPQEYIDKLKSVVTIDQNKANETNISTLNQFIHVNQLLHESLNQELENLPLFVWSFKIAAADLEEQKLINVTKFILTSFANSCSKMAINTKPCKDYERTFWILHVVPIFQTFAYQTGLLSFNWCEIPLTEDEDGTRAVDGISYDVRSKDRLVYEASSGQYYANYDKIIDDNTKQISSMIMMLKEIANTHVNSDFSTFTKSKVFGVQSIKTKIILSELILKEDGSCYHYSEVRSADIPTSYIERNKWIKIFEILCYLFVALNNQERYYQLLENEEQGAILVIPADTVKTKFNLSS